MVLSKTLLSLTFVQSYVNVSFFFHLALHSVHSQACRLFPYHWFISIFFCVCIFSSIKNPFKWMPSAWGAPELLNLKQTWIFGKCKILAEVSSSLCVKALQWGLGGHREFQFHVHIKWANHLPQSGTVPKQFEFHFEFLRSFRALRPKVPHKGSRCSHCITGLSAHMVSYMHYLPCCKYLHF